MALILAINPGNSHSPTLARLARELKGDELVGADSCVVAITAIRSRVPDLVLLPDRSARGESELLAQLRTIRGGVPTLKLPPVASADPPALAKDIRAVLAREPKREPSPEPKSRPRPAPKSAPAPVAAVGPSPHVLAAARAAVAWGQARRAAWAAEAGVAALLEPGEPLDARDSRERDEPDDLSDAGPHEPEALGESDEPPIRRAPRWLPRAAIAAVAIALAGVGGLFFPRLRDAATDAVATPAAPADPLVTSSDAPVEPIPAAAPPEAAETATIGAGANTAAPVQTAASDAAAPQAIAGWVAVFAPFDVVVTRGNDAIALDERGRAMLAPGRHRLRFQNSAMGYDDTRTVEVRPTATTTINLTPETTIAVSSNEPAEVLIDGAHAGDTPFEGRLPLGTRTVVVKGAEDERRFTIEATMKPVQIDVDFSKPQL